jgi:hypothetical protein
MMALRGAARLRRRLGLEGADAGIFGGFEQPAPFICEEMHKDMPIKGTI